MDAVARPPGPIAVAVVECGVRHARPQESRVVQHFGCVPHATVGGFVDKLQRRQRRVADAEVVAEVDARDAWIVGARDGVGIEGLGVKGRAFELLDRGLLNRDAIDGSWGEAYQIQRALVC